MIEQLSRGMTAALAAGDLEAAHVAHEAIGKLLAAPAGPGAAVVDLDGERSKRGRLRAFPPNEVGSPQ